VRTTTNIQIPPQALAALRAGNKIEAIKIIRQAMNVGLAEGKAMVDAFDAGPASASADSTMASAAAAPEAMPARATRQLPRATVPGYVRREGMSPGEVPRSNDAMQFVFFIAVVAIAIAAYVMFG
jgi:hypothetical protein